MSINPFRFVAITSKVGPAKVDIEMSIPIGGGDYQNVISSTENGVCETIVTLPPIASQDLGRGLALSDFELYVSSMDEGNSALLLKAIYIFENSSRGKLLLAIPNWPQTLWIKKEHGPVVGGIGVPKLNLGDVAKVLNL